MLLCLFDFCFANVFKDGGHTRPKKSSETPALLPVWLGEGFSLSRTDHFLVAHDAGSGRAEELAGCLESAFDHFQHFFQQSGFELHAPEGRLSWISFSDPDHFNQYVRRAERMDLSRLTGYYSSRTNRVVMIESQQGPNPSSESISQLHNLEQPPEDISAMTGGDDPNRLVKIAHELAHQLAFNTGLQKRGVMYPLWVSEGLATQYETQLSYCHTTNIARNDRLQEMQSHNRLIPLDEFISLTRLPADLNRCEDIYAQAWGFFQFLLKHYPDQLKIYLKSLYNKKNGFRSVGKINKEFTDTFGSVDQLNDQWTQFICNR